MRCEVQSARCEVHSTWCRVRGAAIYSWFLVYLWIYVYSVCYDDCSAIIYSTSIRILRFVILLYRVFSIRVDICWFLMAAHFVECLFSLLFLMDCAAIVCGLHLSLICLIKVCCWIVWLRFFRGEFRNFLAARRFCNFCLFAYFVVGLWTVELLLHRHVHLWCGANVYGVTSLTRSQK